MTLSSRVAGSGASEGRLGTTAKLIAVGTGCGENWFDIVGGVRLGRSMTLRWQNISVDSTDPVRAATFWEQALGWRRTHEDPDEVVLEPPAGSPEDGVSPDILFLRVPEEKTVKNRLHLDLRPDDQAAEVARLEGLGARRTSIGQTAEVSWVVLADPDGNELCVLRALTADELAQ
jgi:predicted enzyme related to lactoylglutathione lyase